jgi:hypothetical protein
MRCKRRIGGGISAAVQGLVLRGVDDRGRRTTRTCGLALSAYRPSCDGTGWMGARCVCRAQLEELLRRIEHVELESVFDFFEFFPEANDFKPISKILTVR